jgi:hypothetical protein
VGRWGNPNYILDLHIPHLRNIQNEISTLMQGADGFAVFHLSLRAMHVGNCKVRCTVRGRARLVSGGTTAPDHVATCLTCSAPHFLRLRRGRLACSGCVHRQLLAATSDSARNLDISGDPCGASSRSFNGMRLRNLEAAPLHGMEHLLQGPCPVI